MCKIIELLEKQVQIRDWYLNLRAPGVEKGDKSYVNISVLYIDQIAEEAIAKETKELQGKTDPLKKPRIIKSLQEEAEKLSNEFSEWKYQIPKFVFSRFNKTRSSLLKDVVAVEDRVSAN